MSNEPGGRYCVPVTPKDLARVKIGLDRLRAHVVAIGPARIEPSRTDDATTGVADEDAQALSEMLQVLASQRNKDQATLLSAIDRALRKLDRTPDEFGLCEECEEEIDPRRLAIIPYASRCAGCQAKAEPRLGSTRRKLTDYR